MAIDKGVPIPTFNPPKGIEHEFHEFMDMEIGDSVLIPQTHGAPFIEVAIFGIKHNQRHTHRYTENGDIRFWRIL